MRNRFVEFVLFDVPACFIASTPQGILLWVIYNPEQGPAWISIASYVSSVLFVALLFNCCCRNEEDDERAELQEQGGGHG